MIFTGAAIQLPTEMEAVWIAHVPGDPPTPQQILDVLRALPGYPILFENADA